VNEDALINAAPLATVTPANEEVLMIVEKSRRGHPDMGTRVNEDALINADLPAMETQVKEEALMTAGKS